MSQEPSRQSSSTRESPLMKVRVPASTSNLGSGFDVVGLALQMYLEVEASATGSQLEIIPEGLGAPEIPIDRTNLIYRMIVEHAGDRMPGGLKLRIKNGIPLTRGFGSSAAATVAGISLGHWIRSGTPRPRARLHHVVPRSCVRPALYSPSRHACAVRSPRACARSRAHLSTG